MAVDQTTLVREVETAVISSTSKRLFPVLAILAALAVMAALGYLLVEAVSLHEVRAASYLATVALFGAGLVSPSPLQLVKHF